jgi:hypothetical protein
LLSLPFLLRIPQALTETHPTISGNPALINPLFLARMAAGLQILSNGFLGSVQGQNISKK